MIEKQLVFELIDLKPNDSMVEIALDSEFCFQKECLIRDIKYINNIKKVSDISHIQSILLSLNHKTKIKDVKKSMALIKQYKFKNKVFVIIYNKNKKYFFMNFRTMFYLFLFNFQFNPYLSFNYKSNILINQLFIKYPNYLNRSLFFSLKIWFKKIIINTTTFLKGDYNYLIYKVKKF